MRSHFTILLTVLFAAQQHAFEFANPRAHASRYGIATANVALQKRPAAPSNLNQASNARSIERTRSLIDEIITASYPELKGTPIQIKLFESESDYFKARFSVPQFFFGRIQYLVFVNPRVFDLHAPDPGVRAILAHELGHVLYFKTRNRLRLLGLVRLNSKPSTQRFERWADLQAISRGCGDGLKQYRRWLYANIPASKLAEKQRNYFSPEEIDALMSAVSSRPELMAYWLKDVPRSLKEIQQETGAK